jgi:uncharacterized protein (DUF2342 family)
VAVASAKQLAVSSTEAIVPAKLPVSVRPLYSPFIISQEVPVQVPAAAVSVAKLIHLPMSTFMHCSIMLGVDDGNKLGAVLGNLDGTLLGKADGNKLGLMLGSKLGWVLGDLEGNVLGKYEGNKLG